MCFDEWCSYATNYIVAFPLGMLLWHYLFPFWCLFDRQCCLSWALWHRGSFCRPLNSRETFLCWLGVDGWGSAVSEPPSTLYAPDSCILIPTPCTHTLTHTACRPQPPFPTFFFTVSSQFNHLGKYLFMVYHHYFPWMCWRSCLFICTITLSASKVNRVVWRGDSC